LDIDNQLIIPSSDHAVAIADIGNVTKNHMLTPNVNCCRVIAMLPKRKLLRLRWK